MDFQRDSFRTRQMWPLEENSRTSNFSGLWLTADRSASLKAQSCVRWSPDGKGLQYLLTNGDATNIWEQPLAGGSPRQITRFTSGHIFDFSWSLDGKQLFMSRGEVTSDVVLLSNLR